MDTSPFCTIMNKSALNQLFLRLKINVLISLILWKRRFKSDFAKSSVPSQVGF